MEFVYGQIIDLSSHLTANVKQISEINEYFVTHRSGFSGGYFC